MGGIWSPDRGERVLQTCHRTISWQLFKQYNKTTQDQLNSVIEKVTSTSTEGLIKHYIPHHPVITPAKDTTKVRIVYDASAKTKKENKSLNECLYRGPVIIDQFVWSVN